MASMEVSFLAWSLTLPKALVILGSYVLGGASGYGLFQVVKLAIEKM
jgi:uncharacterized integral membrane protein